MTLGIGIAGAGWIAERVYLPFFTERVESATITVHDPDRSRVERMCGLFPAMRVALDFEELIADRSIDLVVVASPNHLHADQALRALRGGKRVICEKPLCVSASELRCLEEAIHRSPGALLPSVVNRFRRDVASLRSFTERGRLGSVYRVSARWLRRRGIPPSDWYRDRRVSGGGVLIDLGPHLIDVALWLADFPAPRRIQAYLSSLLVSDASRFATWHATDGIAGAADVEDNASIFLVGDHLSVSIDLAWAGHTPCDETEIELFGDRGYAKLTSLFGFSTDTPLGESRLKLVDDDGERELRFDLRDRRAPYFAMLECFVHELLENRVSPRAAESLGVLRLIHGVYSGAALTPSGGPRAPAKLRQPCGSPGWPAPMEFD